MKEKRPLVDDKTFKTWLTARVRPDPEQPKSKVITERMIEDMKTSLVALGQLEPIIGYSVDGEWLELLDGECRLLAARRVPLEYLQALVLEHKPSPEELLMAQITVGTVRNRIPTPELADAYIRLMKMTNWNQAQMAARLGTSPTKISNALARHRILPELQDSASQLDPSSVTIIARLPGEDQSEILTFALTPKENGKLPSRDEIQAFIIARKAKTASRAKYFSGEIEGRKFRLELRSDDTHEKLAESLKTLAGAVLRQKSVPVANLNIAKLAKTGG